MCVVPGAQSFHVLEKALKFTYYLTFIDISCVDQILHFFLCDTSLSILVLTVLQQTPVSLSQ